MNHRKSLIHQAHLAGRMQVKWSLLAKHELVQIDNKSRNDGTPKPGHCRLLTLHSRLSNRSGNRSLHRAHTNTTGMRTGHLSVWVLAV